MDFQDFLPPRQTRNLGISSNASVRSTASRLSLRRPDRLSIRGGNTSNFTQCESQRLSPPPSDVWVRDLPATSTPKNIRAPILQGTNARSSKESINFPRPSSTDSTKENTGTGPQNKKTKAKLGSKSKEDSKQPTNNVNNIIQSSENIFKTPGNLPPPVFPVFVSPQKDRGDASSTVSSSISPRKPSSPSPRKPRASPSPRKSEPSPNKSKRSRGSSTVLSAPLDSKGFCPTCQVPFICINVLPSSHSETCTIDPGSEECPAGTECKSTTFFHYRDYKHTSLAEERALAGSDSSDIEIILDENEVLENVSVFSNSSKRKLNYSNDEVNKRTKNNINEKESSSDEESNPFFSPAALEEGDDGEKSGEEEEEEPNPFLDMAEIEAGDESPEQQAEQVQQLPEETDDNINLLPCIPGVCDSKQLAVTLMLTNPATGQPIKVRGIGGPDGWKEIDGADAVDTAQCGCKHNLHINCQNAQLQSQQSIRVMSNNEVAVPGPSIASLWAPLLRRMASSSSTSSSASSETSEASTSSSTSSLSERNCPYYKRIPGTKFAVDAFNCGNVPGIKYYFLSHFHYDHYIGLTKRWTNIIYCSAITARLVKQNLRVRDDLIRVLEVDQTVKLDGVLVTPLDANHCPGSLMLLFQLSDGTNHLHTGDFRASPHMESYSAFWNLDVQNLYLDTTYCNKSYDFPTQEEVVNWAAERAEVNVSVEKNCLFVCGSYTIGKEKIFLAIAEKLDCKIWAPASKIKVLNLLEDPRISNRLTKNGHEAKVHVLPMNKISIKGMQDHMRTVKGVTEIIAFRPSGWQYSGHNNTMHKLEQRGKVTVCSVPYSEHSSFSELKRFVQFLRPKQVIPTVRSQGCTWQQMRTTCQEWLRNSNASLNKAYEGSNSIQTSLKHWKKA